MKKKYLKTLSILLVFSLKSNAQTFEPNFLGEDFLQYKGIYFKIKDDTYSGFTFAFYREIKYCQTEFNDNVIYPDSKYIFKTIKDSLINRIFIVDDIVDENGITCKSSLTSKPIFVLKDTVTKQIIYYKYDKGSQFNFVFNTSKIIYDENAICLKIERKVDDFTGAINLSSPILENHQISSMIIYKDISKAKTLYYLSLSTIGSTLNVKGTGTIVLFEDGTKWNNLSKIDVKSHQNGYEYSAFITLKAEDLITFSTKKVKKYRLYIYDEEVDSEDAKKFKVYVKCIKNAK